VRARAGPALRPAPGSLTAWPERVGWSSGRTMAGARSSISVTTSGGGSLRTARACCSTLRRICTAREHLRALTSVSCRSHHAPRCHRCHASE